MTWPVILKRGNNLNQTLSTIKYDKFGGSTNQIIFICDDWIDGFKWAKEQSYDQALFVNSGSMFTDWIAWKNLIETYPHKGFIAHLIKHPDQFLYLNDQCWFMNLDIFELSDFTNQFLSHPIPVCSDKHLHDNYTPLWATPGAESISYQADNFGQGLISKQLLHNRSLVNWNNSARELKFFLYNGVTNLEPFSEFKSLAETQLWIFNNEPIVIVGKDKLVSPGSGLSWIFNIINPATTHIQIVDISKVQINFCQELWANWDGTNYGEFVWDFIKANNLIHYELDKPLISDLKRLMLRSKSKFIDYTNKKYTELLNTYNIVNFASRWNDAKNCKSVNFCVGNLIQWVIDTDITAYDDVWCSNILNYKWTLLHTSAEDCNKFQNKYDETKNKPVAG